jgi:hypothetical protein
VLHRRHEKWEGAQHKADHFYTAHDRDPYRFWVSTSKGLLFYIPGSNFRLYQPFPTHRVMGSLSAPALGDQLMQLSEDAVWTQAKRLYDGFTGMPDIPSQCDTIVRTSAGSIIDGYKYQYRSDMSWTAMKSMATNA